MRRLAQAFPSCPKRAINSLSGGHAKRLHCYFAFQPAARNSCCLHSKEACSDAFSNGSNRAMHSLIVTP